MINFSGQKREPTYRKFHTIEDAKALEIDYKFWMDPSVEPGDWVATDDGFVVEVKRKRRWVNRVGQGSTYIQTSRGSYCLEYSKEFKIRMNIHNVASIGTSQANPMHYGSGWEQALSTNDRNFVDFIFNGMTAADALKLAYKGKRVLVSKIMRKKAVIKYMAQKYEKEMNEVGLTKSWYFERLKTECENVKDSKLQERFAVLERVAQLLDVVPQKTVEEEGVSGLYLDDESTQMIEGHKKKELTE